MCWAISSKGTNGMRVRIVRCIPTPGDSVVGSRGAIVAEASRRTSERLGLIHRDLFLMRGLLHAECVLLAGGSHDVALLLPYLL